jgi:hypothetical protein
MAREGLSEFKPGVIQPGMEQIVEAGETLEITDNTGQVFAVTGTESKDTLGFIIKFDVWHSMSRSGVQGPVLVQAWKEVEIAFNALPLRVQRQLPSFKALGISTLAGRG